MKTSDNGGTEEYQTPKLINVQSTKFHGFCLTPVRFKPVNTVLERMNEMVYLKQLVVEGITGDEGLVKVCMAYLLRFL